MEMVKPWQLCRTIGPLPSQRFLLASAKAQPRGVFSDKLYRKYTHCPRKVTSWIKCKDIAQDITHGVDIFNPHMKCWVITILHHNLYKCIETFHAIQGFSLFSSYQYLF